MILKVVVRNLLKHPFLNLVKVVGLSLALAGIVFISLFLKNELSYDNYHEKAGRIYRYTITDPDFMFGRHFARLTSIKVVEDFPEAVTGVEEFVRMRPVRDGLMRYKQQHYGVGQGFEVDSTFFKVFDAGLLVGDKQSALEYPASIVLTKSFAEKVFGTENPVGKILVLPSGQYYGEEQSFTVKGVMADFPENSHFHPDFVATPVQDKFASGWAWCYLVLAEGDMNNVVEARIENYLAEQFEQSKDEFNTEVHLQKIGDIHLHSHKFREIESNGSIRNIYVLAIAAIILLVISIGNYANLNMGMLSFSARYLFVTKLLGSSKRSIILYFLIEAIMILAATFLLTGMIATPLNLLIIKNYGLDLLQNSFVFLAVIVLVFGIFCLFFGWLSVLNNVAFKGNKQNTNTAKGLGRGRMSRGLVVFQFAFSIALIIAVIVISRQTSYALKSSLGVQQENILVFEKVHASLQQQFGVFKQELQRYNSIKEVSAMFEPPGGEANDMFPFEMEGYEPGDDDTQNIGVFPCDYAFADVFNLQFIEGENFSKSNIDNEGLGEYIINEAAMRRLNCTKASEAIGKSFQLLFSVPEAGITIPKGKIIGVVKDFHLSSLKKEVDPLVLFKRDRDWLINFVVAFQPGMQQEALADMNKVWTQMFPDYPFQYEHVDVMYEKVYKAELLQARLLSVFTLVALFICSIGLFAMALIVTKNRIKEIGIRKVNGARVDEILLMLNRDFVKWVSLAFVIACPVAWFAMHKWLENFAYKISLSWWIFAIAGVLALGIALLTVSFQSWKTATRNPVEALRYE